MVRYSHFLKKKKINRKKKFIFFKDFQHMHKKSVSEQYRTWTQDLIWGCTRPHLSKEAAWLAHLTQVRYRNYQPQNLICNMGIILGPASPALYPSEVIHVEYLVVSRECRKHTVNVHHYFPGRQ